MAKGERQRQYYDSVDMHASRGTVPSGLRIVQVSREACHLQGISNDAILRDHGVLCHKHVLAVVAVSCHATRELAQQNGPNMPCTSIIIHLVSNVDHRLPGRVATDLQRRSLAMTCKDIILSMIKAVTCRQEYVLYSFVCRALGSSSA